MAPKKKDKSKAAQWLQCSLCTKLVSQQDSELHSTCCSADNGYIQDKVFHGKVVDAENILEEDGTPVTKSIRDKDSVVWLAIQTMQVCGLSIGQPCVVNGSVIKRTWPHKSLALTSAALSQATREELNVNKDEFVSVERFMPGADIVAKSAVLRLRDENPLFETEEFTTFAAGFLEGKFITEGSPILIRYFGQICYCCVKNLLYQLSSPPKEHENLLALMPDKLKTPSTPGKPTSLTPIKSTPSRLTSPCNTTTPPKPETSTTAGAAVATPDSSNQDISDSLASLNISDTADSTSLTSTPTLPLRQKYPTLVTPVKGGGGDAGRMTQSPVFAKVTSHDTVFTVKGPSSDGDDEVDSEDPEQQTSLNDVGGLATQVEELKTRILRAQHPSSSGRCFLIQGPAGTGKSLLVKALTAHLGLHTTLVAGTDIWSKLFGEAESNLRKIFKTAQDRAPSIVVIDDIDVICPKRSQNTSGQQQHRIVATLISLIDEISSKKQATSPVIVLGVTNNRDGLDPALRRAGRFGCEVEIGVPTAPQRTQILATLLRHVPHTLSESDIATVASNAHGYVGADLAALVNEASMHALGKLREPSQQQTCTVTLEDLVYAGLRIKPSALREIQLEVPKVRWSDIGGMSEVKMRLREAVELPLSHPEVFKNLGIEPPRGLLMYGPPGCSKTMVARALATECKLNFLAVKGPELFNQYVGESEKAIREVFRKARSAAPSVVFFDEIDAIAGKRGSSSGGSGVDDRVLTQLLTEMDGLEFLKDVFIMAATNRPDKIDNALLRPGRFDSLVYVPLPDSDTRTEILQKKLARMVVAEDLNLTLLVDATEGYSGAEVVQVCQEAALSALRESLEATTVQQRHFDVALEKVRPQIDPELLLVYDRFSQAIIK